MFRRPLSSSPMPLWVGPLCFRRDFGRSAPRRREFAVGERDWHWRDARKRFARARFHAREAMIITIGYRLWQCGVPASLGDVYPVWIGDAFPRRPSVEIASWREIVVCMVVSIGGQGGNSRAIFFRI